MERTAVDMRALHREAEADHVLPLRAALQEQLSVKVTNAAAKMRTEENE